MAQKYRVTSDWHMEFWSRELGGKWEKQKEFIDNVVLPVMDGEKDTVLLMAGDLSPIILWHAGTNVRNAIVYLCERFKAVVYVPGNHDYYGLDLLAWETGYDQQRQYVRHLPENFLVLGYGGELEKRGRNARFFWKHHGVAGATFWTDCDGENGSTMAAMEAGMSDYRHITYGLRDSVRPKLLEAKDTVFVHRAHKKHVLRYADDGGVVMTHHMPTFGLVSPKYKGSPINGAFASACDAVAEACGVKLWVCGHTHEAMDYWTGYGCRMLVNPFGYVGYEVDPEGKPSNGYRNRLVVEVGV